VGQKVGGDQTNIRGTKGSERRNRRSGEKGTCGKIAGKEESHKNRRKNSNCLGEGIAIPMTKGKERGATKTRKKIYFRIKRYFMNRNRRREERLGVAKKKTAEN